MAFEIARADKREVHVGALHGIGRRLFFDGETRPLSVVGDGQRIDGAGRSNAWGSTQPVQRSFCERDSRRPIRIAAAWKRDVRCQRLLDLKPGVYPRQPDEALSKQCGSRQEDHRECQLADHEP